jgi:CheY-like chemotaxis protein
LANNGTEALAQAVKHQPDLVLLDIRMPDMDGREALAELRKTEGFEEVPVISVTASSMMAEELELRREFNGYIRKPFSRAQLFREVSRVLPRVEGSEEADTAKAAERAGEIGTSESELVAEKPRPEWQPLLDQLKDWEATRWPQLVKSMSTRDTASFARDLKRQGKEADCPSVVAYADKLLQQVERFQISAQETTLRGYPQLVHGVADQISA